MANLKLSWHYCIMQFVKNSIITRMHSSRMAAVAGHTCPLPTTHTHCHAHPLPHMPACHVCPLPHCVCPPTCHSHPFYGQNWHIVKTQPFRTTVSDGNSSQIRSIEQTCLKHVKFRVNQSYVYLSIPMATFIKIPTPILSNCIQCTNGHINLPKIQYSVSVNV